MDASGDLDRVRDYIVGRLSEEERRSFEERLVRDPELVREFEQALAFRAGLKQLQAEGYFLKPVVKSATRVNRLLMWLPAFTAAAIAALALFLWTERSAAPPGVLLPTAEPAASAGAAPVAAQFTFISMRGASTPDLSLPLRGLIEFRAAPGIRGAAAQYRMTLVRNDETGPSRIVGTLSGLALGGDGYVHGYAEAARLAPGSYLLRVDSGATGAGASEAFPFILRASGGR